MIRHYTYILYRKKIAEVNVKHVIVFQETCQRKLASYAQSKVVEQCMATLGQLKIKRLERLQSHTLPPFICIFVSRQKETLSIQHPLQSCARTSFWKFCLD